ncbi:hypothetical protein Clacol_007081 [Clathrus columnatus]|uniref:S-adenosyl-L-methionine-dependent methyltransferase n=1 Tax=Clathrus columnatus TaxID=1419009 RepID=A0AAV5AIS8_9AGAM|nr:hypothetical protein Clacol_007081 [Clathrus columnatus]
MSNDPLTALVSIISSSVQNLQKSYSEQSLKLPTLDERYIPVPLDNDSQIKDSVERIVAAATQLIAAVRYPRDTIHEQAQSMYLSALLAFVVDVNIPEILNEVHNKSLHAKDIASRIGCDPSHISRVLRYLATRHIFKEVVPGEFANNRVSYELIKANNKTVAELQEKPLEKYADSGTAAFVGHAVGEGLMSSTALSDFLKSGGKHAKTPFNAAFNTDLTLWDWFTTSENSWRFGRFVAAMHHFAEGFKDEIFVNGYNWGKLTSNDVVVDVGGNMGTVTMALAKAFKEPKFIIQDLSPVISQAKGFWEEYDFFTEQPIKGAAVYFLRFIIQDWPTSEAIKILKRIREAANPSSSKLILFEFNVPYACEDPNTYPESIEVRTAPYPLLPNLGKGGGPNPTYVDIQMMTMLNGQGRDLGELIALGEASGWKLEAAKNDELSIFVFSPMWVF